VVGFVVEGVVLVVVAVGRLRFLFALPLRAAEADVEAVGRAMLL
jgi:hypothetical protein